MMIKHTIFARSNTIFSNQNSFSLYIVLYYMCIVNIIEEGIVKILLDQDDRVNKFCPNIYKWPWYHTQLVAIEFSSGIRNDK